MSKNRNEKHKIIIGGGIAGLLYAFYNPDYLLITDKIGGQSKSKFQLGPRILHKDEFSTRLLTDLKRYIPIKKIKVGYFYNNKINNENTEENKKKYFEKTRGESSQPYSSVMSSNQNEYDSYDIDLSDIIENLERRIENKIILGTVSKIDTTKKSLIVNNEEIKYSELISTIPLNVFLFLTSEIEKAKLFKSFSTQFVLMNNIKDCIFTNFDEYDYVYDSDEKHSFHRVSKTKNGYVFEYKGEKNILPDLIKDIEVIKVGQLIENNIKINFDKVKFFGRYAEWKHNILINDLLKKIYTKK
ncbi:MAG: hypothetical protein WC438_05525 [Candidatus Pacearchaeota archaeon]